MTFWKPGTAGPGIEFDKTGDGEEQVVYNTQFQLLSINQQRTRLPIFKHSMSIRL
jgi:hypothetical protein